MKNTTDVDRRSNVIPMPFKERRETSIAEDDVNQIPHDIAHPASKNFQVNGMIDDPLAEILSEYEEMDFDENDLEDEQEEDYIFHHQKDCDYQVDFNDSNKQMAETILEQIKRLRDDSKRIRYYLQELNLD